MGVIWRDFSKNNSWARSGLPGQTSYNWKLLSLLAKNLHSNLASLRTRDFLPQGNIPQTSGPLGAGSWCSHSARNWLAAKPDCLLQCVLIRSSPLGQGCFHAFPKRTNDGGRTLSSWTQTYNTRPWCTLWAWEVLEPSSLADPCFRKFLSKADSKTYALWCCGNPLSLCRVGAITKGSFNLYDREDLPVVFQD